MKLHTLIDLRWNIPVFIEITDGKVHDVNILDILIPEAESFYIMDRGYIDFARLFLIHLYRAFFVVRAKKNFKYRRLYSQTVDKSTGLRCDQIIVVTGIESSKDYPEKLRRIKYYDVETDKLFVFITNNFTLPSLVIAQLYKYRWQVELFFKWIKQHLRIKTFFGTSENAVKTQVWIAVSVYVLIAIIKKQSKIEKSLYTILQILSITVFEKLDILQVLTNIDCNPQTDNNNNQLLLFDL